MDSSDFEDRLRGLFARIEALPEEERGPLYALARETRARQLRVEAHRRRSERALDKLRVGNRRLEQQLQQARDRVSDASLQAKLTLFDLEARRREREAEH